MLVGFGFGVRPGLQIGVLGESHLARQDGQRFVYHAILELKYVPDRGSDTARTKLAMGDGINQAAIDAQRRSCLLQAALEDQVSPKFLASLLGALNALSLD